LIGSSDGWHAIEFALLHERQRIAQQTVLCAVDRRRPIARIIHHAFGRERENLPWENWREFSCVIHVGDISIHNLWAASEFKKAVSKQKVFEMGGGYVVCRY
jgi:hypothetical protein